MPLLALLLILVLPFQRVIAFVTSAPTRLTSQSQGHSHHQLMAWIPANGAVSAPSSLETISKGISSPPLGHSLDHAVVGNPSNLLDGLHLGTLQNIASTQLVADVQPESLSQPPAIVQENDFVQTVATVQEFLEKLPDSAEFGLIVVLFLLAASLANSMKGTKVVDPSAATSMSTAKEKQIEEAVAGLSQSVVVLTQEIKAIKDTTNAPQKLKQLELQNAALEQELQTTMVQARSLSTLQVSRSLHREWKCSMLVLFCRKNCIKESRRCKGPLSPNLARRRVRR